MPRPLSQREEAGRGSIMPLHAWITASDRRAAFGRTGWTRIAGADRGASRYLVSREGRHFLVIGMPGAITNLSVADRAGCLLDTPVISF
jgi:hypothetical protein